MAVEVYGLWLFSLFTVQREQRRDGSEYQGGLQIYRGGRGSVSVLHPPPLCAVTQKSFSWLQLIELEVVREGEKLSNHTA